MKFGYQFEKLSNARRALMLPHPQGEAESIASAFHHCLLGFRDLDANALDDDARRCVSKITEFMDTKGIEDTTGRGTWAIKAGRLTSDQKFELTQVIDELAHWFESRYYGSL